MGGCAFFTYAEGKDLNKAFSEAHDAAAWESGHGGYTGTIAEKPGAVLRKSEPMSQKDAMQFAQSDFEDNDKWGDAYAVRVKDVTKDGKPFEGFLFYGWASS